MPLNNYYPLTKTPFFEAPPIPPKKLKGIEITKAHGQDTTRNASALYIQSLKVAPSITRGGIIARKTAIIPQLVYNISQTS